MEISIHLNKQWPWVMWEKRICAVSFANKANRWCRKLRNICEEKNKQIERKSKIERSWDMNIEHIIFSHHVLDVRWFSKWIVFYPKKEWATKNEVTDMRICRFNLMNETKPTDDDEQEHFRKQKHATNHRCENNLIHKWEMRRFWTDTMEPYLVTKSFTEFKMNEHKNDMEKNNYGSLTWLGDRHTTHTSGSIEMNPVNRYWRFTYHRR